MSLRAEPFGLEAEPFGGAKIALICRDWPGGPAILVYLRDDFAHLPFPGRWDLPGGGREGDETPEACALRELEEEFGLVLPPARLIWHRRRAPCEAGTLPSHFYGAWLAAAEAASVRFGDEGQSWRMMPLAEFHTHPGAVPHLRARSAAFAASAGIAPDRLCDGQGSDGQESDGQGSDGQGSDGRGLDGRGLDG